MAKGTNMLSNSLHILCSKLEDRAEEAASNRDESLAAAYSAEVQAIRALWEILEGGDRRKGMEELGKALDKHPGLSKES